MKKKTTILILLVLLIFSVTFATTAFAEEGTPPPEPIPPPESNGEIYFRGIDLGDFDGSVLHELLIKAFIEITGLYEDEVQAFLDKGMNLVSIAILLGYSGEDLTDLMEKVGEEALDLAVEKKLISQGIADAISDRVDQLGSSLNLMEQLGLTREELKEMLASGMTICDIAIEQDIGFTSLWTYRCRFSTEEYQVAFEERYFLVEDYREVFQQELESRWGTFEGFIGGLKWWDLIDSVEW